MSLAQHLPALQVVPLLLAAPLAVLLRQRDWSFTIVLGAVWATFAASVALWLQVAEAGTLSYAVGNWPPPWGIELRVDMLNAFVLVLVSGVAAVVFPACRAGIEAEVPPQQHYLFHCMFALCVLGLQGIAVTGDAFNVFVFLEVSSLATYVLIALGRDRRALVASYQYLILGTIGATLFVIGVGLLYLMTGTLNIADLGQRLPAVQGTRPVLAALAFITVGVSLKLALFPLHQWLPNAYAYSPSPVAAFLAGTATKVAVYVLLRFYFGVFGGTAVFASLAMQQALLVLALAGMLVASAIAIWQTDLKRLFAFSSVGQIGYIILGVSFMSASGLTAGVVHLFNHGITKAAVFLLLGAVALRMGGTSLSRIQGLGQRMPLVSAGLVVCGLSLIGVPGTAGFISKWYLVQAALERGQWWLALVVVGSSLLAAAYTWRFIDAAYFRAPRQDTAQGRAVHWSVGLCAGALVVATVWFGLDTSFTVGSAAQAAQAMLGGLR